MTLPLLKEGNYTEWRARVKAYLVLADLWEVVGPVEDEKPAKSGKETNTKRKKRELAYAKILETLSSSQMSYVLDSEDPREAWGALEEIHRSTSVNSILALRCRFFRMTKLDDESIIAWISRVRGAALEMKDSPYPVSEIDIVMVCTDGLDPEKYGDIVAALDTLPATQVRMADVTTRLLGKEAMLNRRGEKMEDAAIFANYAADRRGGKGSGAVSQDGLVCFNCGGCGHYADKCPSPPSLSSHRMPQRNSAGRPGMHQAHVAFEDGTSGSGERAAVARVDDEEVSAHRLSTLR